VNKDAIAIAGLNYLDVLRKEGLEAGVEVYGPPTDLKDKSHMALIFVAVPTDWDTMARFLGEIVANLQQGGFVTLPRDWPRPGRTRAPAGNTGPRTIRRN